MGQYLSVSGNSPKMRTSCLIVAFVLSISSASSGLERQKRGDVLNEVCRQCQYCLRPEGCIAGCARCKDCSSQTEPACELCFGESEKACLNRCIGGCNICKGEDGNGLNVCKNL